MIVSAALDDTRDTAYYAADQVIVDLVMFLLFWHSAYAPVSEAGGNVPKAFLKYPTRHTAGTAQGLSGAVVQRRALQPFIIGTLEDHSLCRVATNRKYAFISMTLVSPFLRVKAFTGEEMTAQRLGSGD